MDSNSSRALPVQVMGNEICFERSHYQQLHELFHSREIMHRQVYTHWCGAMSRIKALSYNTG